MSFRLGIIQIILLGYSFGCCGQGRINNYFMGYVSWPRAYMDFPNNLPVLNVDSNITLSFRYTHANISDSIGDVLFYTNGVSVIDANHDSMPNGTGLNPCAYTTQAANLGLSIPQAGVILPSPGIANEYFLIHQSLNNLSNYTNTNLYYTKINMNLNNGMGGVVQKNIVLYQDTLWACGTTACKHANGRDWWVIVLQAHNPNYLVFLLTPAGISYHSTQSIGNRWEWGQTALSFNGEQYGFYNSHDGMEIFDFDRCSGIFSNPRVIQTNDSLWGLGFCFSPDSKLAYIANAHYINQVNLDSANLLSSLDTVAKWDSTYNPQPPIETGFEFMQIGPDGKIYMTTTWATPTMHYIDNPDSLGTACGVQQHALALPTYNGNTIPNFVNYFLGAVTGSICDSLGVGIPENALHDFKFSIQPNPLTDNVLHFKYQLPQNKPGFIEISDITGRMIRKKTLPQWSTEQHIKLNVSPGIYLVKLKSNFQQVVKKIVVP